MHIEDVVALFNKLDSIVKDMGEIKQDIGTVKADIHSLAGNGQPGRVGKLEAEVKKLNEESHFWKGALWIVGLLAGSSLSLQIWHAIAATIK